MGFFPILTLNPPKVASVWMIYLIYLQNFREKNFAPSLSFLKGSPTIFRGLLSCEEGPTFYVSKSPGWMWGQPIVGDPYHGWLCRVSFRNNIQTLPDERDFPCLQWLANAFHGKNPRDLGSWKGKIHARVMCEKWLMKIDELFGTEEILHLQTSWYLGNHTPISSTSTKMLEVLSFPPSYFTSFFRPLKVDDDDMILQKVLISRFPIGISDALPIGFCTIFWAKGFPLGQILVKSHRLETQDAIVRQWWKDISPYNCIRIHQVIEFKQICHHQIL